MEKYDIPEPNSLNSMEGVEKELDKIELGSSDVEISLELEKLVMDKVRNIYEYGTAYNGLQLVSFDTMKLKKTLEPEQYNHIVEEETVENLQSIFRYGVQSRYNKNRETPVATNYKQYRNKTAGYKHQKDVDFGWQINHGRNTVYFNIVGRTMGGHRKIGTDYSREGVSIIFDLPKEEIFPVKVDDSGKLKSSKVKLNQFTISDHNDAYFNHFLKHPSLRIRDERIKDGKKKEEEYFKELGRDVPSLSEAFRQKPGWDGTKRTFFTHFFNDRGDVTATPDSGFLLKYRIAPRKIKGLVLSDFRRKDTSFIVKTMLVACVEHPEYIVPIYDEDGNLLWPQKLSYEDIVGIKNK